MLTVAVASFLSFLSPMGGCPAIEENNLIAVCDTIPWGRPVVCPLADGLGPTPEKCLDLFELMCSDSSDPCDLTMQEYTECALDLAVAACGVRPESCARVFKCIDNSPVGEFFGVYP